MNTKKDYYEILGASKDISAEDLKKLYRKLVMQYHPDRVPQEKKKEAEEKFKEISEAYAVLSDQGKRQLYDKYGHAGIDSRYSTEDIFRNADFSDIFGNQEGFGNIFESLFSDLGFDFSGMRRSSRSARQRGEDVNMETHITLEQAAKGLEQELSFNRYDECSHCQGSGSQAGSKKETCPTCKGRGMVTSGMGFINFAQPCTRCKGEGIIIKNPCVYCSGSGREKVKKTLKVTIPAGVDNGSVLRLRNEGHFASGGRGDFYLHIGVLPHQIFQREDSDLHCSMKIGVYEAILGTEINVHTLDGNVTMKIPPGTGAHTTFRLKGKGVIDLHSKRVGDLLVKIDIEIPKKISSRERALLIELMKLKKEEF